MNDGFDEKLLSQIWMDVFSCDFKDIDESMSIFEMGADSTAISSLNFKVMEAFKVELQLEDVFENPTFHGVREIVIKLLTQDIDI